MDNKEDAVIMTVEGITSAPYVKRFQDLKQDHVQRWVNQVFLAAR